MSTSAPHDAAVIAVELHYFAAAAEAAGRTEERQRVRGGGHGVDQEAGDADDPRHLQVPAGQQLAQARQRRAIRQFQALLGAAGTWGWRLSPIHI